MSTPAWQGMPIPQWRRPPEDHDVRIVGDPSAPSSGEVRPMAAEVVEAEGPTAAVDEVRVREAAPASPPLTIDDRARDQSMLGMLHGVLIGWAMRVQNRPMPAVDPTDALNPSMRNGWAMADAAADVGIRIDQTTPLAVGEEIRRRLAIIGNAAKEAKATHDALTEAVTCVQHYTDAAWQAVRVMPGMDRSAIDDGRAAVACLGSLRAKGAI